MKKYIKEKPWSIVEEGFDPSVNEISESLFSIGNGAMGQRANFEEYYSGKTLQGTYVGGVYYPDKTRVGWWKNGYPEYFAKVLNAANWIGLDVKIDGETLDLSMAKEIISFRRELDMKSGVLKRSFQVVLKNGAVVNVEAERFVSMHDSELGAITYKLSLEGDARIDLNSFIDGNVVNRDSNYDESFWLPVEHGTNGKQIYLSSKTKKTGFVVGIAAQTQIAINGEIFQADKSFSDDFHAEQIFTTYLKKGQVLEITKLVSVLSSLNHRENELRQKATSHLQKVASLTYHDHKTAHMAIWENLWQSCDVKISGDVAAQQGIRFNIFQLLQTYTGKDARLNIGPKGFTGEKYGGSTYWDTEAYCLPFYMSTAGANVAKNLLVYRYNQLGKAIENANKLGFGNGAALYPMVTMNGEECHNEWEITFEEIHRNGAIAYAIYDYIRYSGDEKYLEEYGLEVLIAISRFWKERVNWSQDKKKYVILGVTGPNEYENNVNNNWYTNYVARWCLQYTIQAIKIVKANYADSWVSIVAKTAFDNNEMMAWKEIIQKIYLPHDHKRNIYLQQDGFLDKELMQATDIPEDQRPINQNWSWDRILRSCFIKQADVLQALFFFEEQFSMEEIENNFNFYEPMTVHESSLSPCVHVILACLIVQPEKAYELNKRTARLDLNDYNNDTEDGLHITSMAGTWMSVVKGFGGMRVKDGLLSFQPTLPESWSKLNFKITFRTNILEISVDKDKIEVANLSGNNIEIIVNNVKFEVIEHSIFSKDLRHSENLKSVAT